MAESQEKIEKPWAVYGYLYGANGIGKIVSKKNGSLWIKDSESQYVRREPWNPKWVRTFDSHIKAIAYFLVHQNKRLEYPYTREQVCTRFFQNFPSQKESLEQYAQTQPLCTKTPQVTLDDVRNID